jgi:hypothetical protein
VSKEPSRRFVASETVRYGWPENWSGREVAGNQQAPRPPEEASWREAGYILR